MHDKNLETSTIALKKARTLISRIIKMIEEDKYCIDILQQILASKGLLNSASNKILEHHLSNCFTRGIKSSNTETKKKLINEVVEVVNLGGRTK
ncbi:metal-sensitive transcriptional regulator [Patescibacteria group bacterium]|nr:metal-sensitive transcriptional regulator [Patescibacteria group bacterium]